MSKALKFFSNTNKNMNQVLQMDHSAWLVNVKTEQKKKKNQDCWHAE